VVFFAVGFETTAPATALAVVQAHSSRLSNFSALVAHVLVRPAMRAILEAPDSAVDGFLAAGHVCAVTGYAGYEEFAARFGVPIVVTGFEPLDILEGIHACLLQLEQGRAEVENQYARVVRREGNPAAQRYLAEVFRVTSRRWRGLGELPASGFALADAYAGFDAARRFGLAAEAATEPSVCLADRVLRGAMKPTECPAFARNCSPQTPLGAPMVSTEGACAAYFWYRGQGATGETLT
jgi:hydrogenase expression/formation protein HypD